MDSDCALRLLTWFFSQGCDEAKWRKGKQVIAITKLKDALSYAEQDIKDRWEFYKERFTKNWKK